MLKNTVLLVVFIAGAVGLAGCSNTIQESQSFTTESEITADGINVGEAEKTDTQQEAPKEENTQDSRVALYTDFTQERYADLLGKEPFAIFFHASWCPDCVNLENQIMKNIASLPKEAIILKANYDTESELKLTYGITIQSTVVVIDKNGNAAPTLFGPSFDDLRSAIEQSI